MLGRVRKVCVRQPASAPQNANTISKKIKLPPPFLKFFYSAARISVHPGSNTVLLPPCPLPQFQNQLLTVHCLVIILPLGS